MRSLDNSWSFPEDRQIAESIRDVTESQDPEEMQEKIIAFIAFVAKLLVRKLELSGTGREEFLSAHTLRRESLDTIVREAHSGEMSPDTLQSYFLSTAIPDLIDNACVAFDDEDAERERHAILPIIRSLHKHAASAVATLADADLSMQARQALEQAARRIGDRIKSTWSVH